MQNILGAQKETQSGLRGKEGSQSWCLRGSDVNAERVGHSQT